MFPPHKIRGIWYSGGYEASIKILQHTKAQPQGEFDDPEWLIMFIAVLSVKAKAKTYLAIHRLALQYWDIIAAGLDLKPIPESTLRCRLKKSATRLEDLQCSFFRYFLEKSSLERVSSDKMMVRAKGPVWHQKQKKQGIVPKDLRGLDEDATWTKSKAKGWIYGHGTFMLTPLGIPIVGIFQWMRNLGNEANRMHEEIKKYADSITKVFIDSKADDQNTAYGYKYLKRRSPSDSQLSSHSSLTAGQPWCYRGSQRGDDSI